MGKGHLFWSNNREQDQIFHLILKTPCADPEGGGIGGPDPSPPPPLKNHKNIGFLSNTGPDHLQITKLPSQHSMWAIIGPPAKCHFNGVSLAG